MLLDKDAGMSSNQALQKLKRLLGVRKAGHTGSLDPIATGLLPICLGEATKLSSYLLDADKRYSVTIRLGVTTNTSDAEGEIVEHRSVPAFSETDIEAVLSRYRGTLDQIPPMYSALKFQGKRLYELARQGIEVPRKSRRITIHALTLEQFQGDNLKLNVHCTKGTYIRTLAADIGETLGCGGHVRELRRTAVDDLSVSDAHTLESLASQPREQRASVVSSASRLIRNLPALSLSDELVGIVRQGQAVFVPKMSFSGHVSLFSRSDTLVGIGEVLDDGRVAPRRILNIC